MTKPSNPTPPNPVPKRNPFEWTVLIAMLILAAAAASALPLEASARPSGHQNLPEGRTP